MKPKKYKPVEITGMPAWKEWANSVKKMDKKVNKILADYATFPGIGKTSVVKRLSLKDLDALTIIPGRYFNLAINWDADDLRGPAHKRYAIMLFTPDMENTNDHHHIQFTRKQAKALRNWLTRFLAKTKRKGK